MDGGGHGSILEVGSGIYEESELASRRLVVWIA